jgi:hypothetical protein
LCLMAVRIVTFLIVLVLKHVGMKVG